MVYADFGAMIVLLDDKLFINWKVNLPGVGSVLKTGGTVLSRMEFDSASLPPICCLGIAGAYTRLKSEGTLFNSERQHQFKPLGRYWISHRSHKADNVVRNYISAPNKRAWRSGLRGTLPTFR